MMNTFRQTKTFRCQSRAQRPARQQAGRNGVRAAGFTLIEVVVAIAIFLIGALAIIRIFPPALGVIQNSENRTIGTNLSRSTLARFETEPGLVPDAVYDFVPAANGGPATVELASELGGRPQWFDFYGAVVGTISKNNSMPTGRSEAALIESALGRFRRIVAERHTVLLDDSSPPKKFVLTRHPYTGPVAIYTEDKVNGVKVDKDGVLDFSEARLASTGGPFHDTTTNATSDPKYPPADRRSPLPTSSTNPDGGVMYYVTYRWREDVNGSERIQGVTDEPLYFPENGDTSLPTPGSQVWQGQRLTDKVIPGEVNVRFTRRVGSYNPTGSTQDRDDFMGAVEIPDVAATADISPGDIVSLNYVVKDWRWIVDEGPPSQAPVSDRSNPIPSPDTTPLLSRTLSIRGLDNEQTLQPTWVRSLITHTLPNGVTGVSRSSWGNASDPNGKNATNQRLQYVNPKTSQVTFDLQSPTLIAPRARTIYWTLDRWAQQTTVGARSYMPFDDARPDVEREKWREYHWGTAGAAESNKLYFHPSEAGKSVLVVFQYDHDPTGATDYRIAVSHFTIDDRFTGSDRKVKIAGFSDTNVSDGPVAVVELTRPDGGLFDDSTSNNNVVAIISVQGISTRARAAWLDNGRYTQAAAAGYRPLDES